MNTHIRFFGRRKSKPLTAKVDMLYTTFWPDFEVTSEGLKKVATLGQLFPNIQQEHSDQSIPVYLEIGCGSGEHVNYHAQQNPGSGYIAVEPFLNGRARTMADALALENANLRLCDQDVRELMPAFSAQCLDGVYILYPDPWRKSRHAKRRLIQPDFLKNLARTMKPGAPLFVASDHPDYQAWIWNVCQESPYFVTIPGEMSDYTRPFANWESTRYEKKAIRENRQPLYFMWKRTKIINVAEIESLNQPHGDSAYESH